MKRNKQNESNVYSKHVKLRRANKRFVYMFLYINVALILPTGQPARLARCIVNVGAVST